MPQTSNEKEVNAYIRSVLSGKIVAGRLVKAACQRHLDDLKSAKKKGFYFDKKLANRAIDFARCLKHSTGEWDGRPFELVDFQKFITWCLFGWRRASDGMRRFRRAFVSLGSGNGKSPFAAFVILFCFVADSPPEPRAECYCLATKESQAGVVFDEVKRFRAHEPMLESMTEALKRNINIPATGSKLEPLGADGEVDDGLVPHCVVVDEIHRWRDHHREMWDMITSKMGKRRQPLLLVITTAGDDQSELWLEQYGVACKVVERGNNIEIDDLFVFIAQIDDDDNPLDEAVWPKANPMLKHGVVKIDELRSFAKVAKIDPRQMNRLTRLRMNRQVTSKVRAITSELWGHSQQPMPDLAGRTGHGGLDWGWKDDLTGLAFAFPLEPIDVEGTSKRRVAFKVDVWIPESGARDLTHEPWASWIRDKWLLTTPGKVTDTEAIYARLNQRREEFGISTIAVDPNNAREFGSRVKNEHGIDAFWFGQTCGKYNEPMREFLDMLREGRAVIEPNPLLAWCALNVIIKSDYRGYIMPDKGKSREKIDPIVAMIMALSEVMFAEREPVLNYYETHDVEAG